MRRPPPVHGDPVQKLRARPRHGMEARVEPGIPSPSQLFFLLFPLAETERIRSSRTCLSAGRRAPAGLLAGPGHVAAACTADRSIALDLDARNVLGRATGGRARAGTASPPPPRKAAPAAPTGPREPAHRLSCRVPAPLKLAVGVGNFVGHGWVSLSLCRFRFAVVDDHVRNRPIPCRPPRVQGETRPREASDVGVLGGVRSGS